MPKETKKQRNRSDPLVAIGEKQIETYVALEAKHILIGEKFQPISDEIRYLFIILFILVDI